ncbi:hypothetical protein BDY24DRAFT_9451 [Mrakia frigida]|uniref:uncharacterized protein n=1 Tax=Mrakia frigida TaxID=29902 RepID=UPI003FCC0650
MLQIAGPRLYRDLEVQTARSFLALFFESLFLFLFQPSTLPKSSRLRPFLGIQLLSSLSLSLPKSQFYNGPLASSDTLPPPLRLLSSPVPLNLHTLDLTIPNLSALKLYLSLLLPHFNPLNLLLHPPLDDQLYFIPFQVERRLLLQAFGHWDRLLWISFCSLAVLGLESKTLFSSEPSLFPKMPRISFDFRNAKPGSSVATSYSLPGPGAASWALAVEWVVRRGTKDVEGIEDGGVELVVGDRLGESRLVQCLEKLSEEERKKYRITMRG